MKFKKVINETYRINPIHSTYPINNNKKKDRNLKNKLPNSGHNFRCPACGTRQQVDFDSFLDGTANCIKCKNRLA